jgi:branched-chain amino acid transport system substrate-binding protein
MTAPVGHSSARAMHIPRGHARRIRILAVATFAIVAVLGETVFASNAFATQAGVTSTSIKVGAPYVDLSSLKALGISINQGSYPDAYNALIANLNSTGGINGRKVTVVLNPVNPTGTAGGLTACTQLIQDDNVFAALGPLQPSCFQTAGVPAINGTMNPSLSPTAAPNFTLNPPPAAFASIEIPYFTKNGVFKGKKVAVFAGGTGDKPELTAVLAALKKQHVNVVQTAIDSAATGDLVATNQQAAVIAQKFQSAGATVVVAVGSGSATWPQAQTANQSPYKPRLVATNFLDLEGYQQQKTSSGDAAYLKGLVSATPIPSYQAEWTEPAVKKCVSIIREAYPSTVIGSPIGATSSTPTTWVAAVNTCQVISMFSTIAKAAGKNLTAASFAKAGYGLRNVTFAGAGAPVSFGPGRAYALGPVYSVTFNSSTNQLVVATKSVAS